MSASEGSPGTPAAGRGRLVQALAALEAWGSARDWRGSDAVSLAQVVSAYARYRFLPTEEAPSKLADAIGELELRRCAGFAEPCWGAPDAIATACAGLALLDAFETTGERRLVELAEGAGDFFLHHIPPRVDSGGAYFGKLAGDQTPIHHVNLQVCALMSRLAQRLGRPDFRQAAADGVGYTAARQHADGSWPCGEGQDRERSSGFHTGSVLESLVVCAVAGVGEGGIVIERGLDHYRRELFLSEGTPKHDESSPYPIDTRCAAQGIQTFSRASALSPEVTEQAWKVFAYAVRGLRRRDGAFILRRRRFWRDRTPDVRRAAAPMLLAMTHLFETTERGGKPEDGRAPDQVQS